ncbi:MAG: peptidoglycan DD-metalloendopeptidase family protein [Candidatus Omnitrophica bacterium]|nr:peptidoglycan DD-metalloendopeptidase family protein [Candidatus Omnitrophota bacterium]MDD5353156.1 peptidoglycan DD-metalloendopeptidase family protein [Candidatus Omnitrophota bacterium]MDD5551136.1 peptidoglycan DD-metalloendopeptidase family protein [Candidatus Omnitrophota bacterium]
MKIEIIKPFEKDFPISFKFGASPDWYVKIFGYPHNGVDFACPIGTPILACDDGKVCYADSVPDRDGIGINIGHDWGMSQYWHLSKLFAKYGAVVKKGDVIGISGATGIATGPHLHFGTYVPEDSPAGMRGWANPLKYIIGTPTQPQPNPVSPQYYLVRPGDTLWKIAEKFYGSGIYWSRIFELNRDKIKNPGLIFPLQKLLIP